METVYKQAALDLYIKRILQDQPNIDNFLLEVSKSAFSAGFNMGTWNDMGQEAQELALKIMVR